MQNFFLPLFPDVGASQNTHGEHRNSSTGTSEALCNDSEYDSSCVVDVQNQHIGR